MTMNLERERSRDLNEVSHLIKFIVNLNMIYFVDLLVSKH